MIRRWLPPARVPWKTGEPPARGSVLLGCLSVMVMAAFLMRAGPGRADTEGVPAALQVALFAKIFPYNRGLPPSFKILIVYTAEFAPMAREIQNLFERSAQAVESVPVAGFAQASRGAHVIYVLAKATPADVQAFCKERHVFSVSPNATLAERGEVSVAIGLKPDGKPEVIVHLSHARAEGQELSIQLLSLARVIR